MNASVVASVLYVLGFFSLYAVILLLHKSGKKLNGVMWLVLSLLVEMCWGTLAAGIVNLVHIPINIYSMGLIYLASAVALGTKICREKKIQKYEWHGLDILFSLVTFLAVAVIVYWKAGPNLELFFFNSDAAVHLKNAVSLVLSQRLPVMYFAPLQLGMVLEVMMPVMPIYDFYEVFIIVDAAFFGIEIIFFFEFCREYLKSKRMKIIGVAMCILYAAGYPMLSYLFSFYYWAIGVMLLGFAALLLRMYKEGETDPRYLVFLLMLCSNAIVMCYMLIAPMAYIATFLGLAVIVKVKGKLVTGENILLALKVFLLPTLLAVYYCLFEFLMKEGKTAAEVISTDGGIYRELYADFLLLVPLVVYTIICAIRQKKIDENIIFFGVTCAFVLVLFVCAGRNLVSGYYFYKFYYPLWFFFFVLAIQGAGNLPKEQWEMRAGYGAMCALLFVMHYGKVEQFVVLNVANFQEEYRADGFFSLYDFNLGYLKMHGNIFPEDYMDICRYVVKELDGEGNVPLIPSFDNYFDCFWYEAMTGNDCSEYYEWQYSFDEVKEKLESGKVEAFAVFRKTNIFRENKDYFSDFDVIYENPSGTVYRNRGH